VGSPGPRGGPKRTMMGVGAVPPPPPRTSGPPPSRSSYLDVAKIIDAVEEDQRDRVGVCIDTCHAWAAGYDLAERWDEVWEEFDEVVGFDRLHLFHVNDSKNPFDSRKDRHAGIGEGTMGLEPFRNLMNDDRMTDIPKILETPKGKQNDPADERNLGILRDLRE